LRTCCINAPDRAAGSGACELLPLLPLLLLLLLPLLPLLLLLLPLLLPPPPPLLLLLKLPTATSSRTAIAQRSHPPARATGPTSPPKSAAFSALHYNPFLLMIHQVSSVLEPFLQHHAFAWSHGDQLWLRIRCLSHLQKQKPKPLTLASVAAAPGLGGRVCAFPPVWHPHRFSLLNTFRHCLLRLLPPQPLPHVQRPPSQAQVIPAAFSLNHKPLLF
jgi:hypothetical protein